MGLERIYNFRLVLDKNGRALFPEAWGKEGHARLAAIDARLRVLFAPLGGVILALSVSQRAIRLTWQEDNRQPGVLQKIEALLSGGQAADGILLLELFLSDEPENPGLLYALGTAYCDQNNLERALELLSRLVEGTPEHVNGRVAKGAALLRAGRIAEAVSELERAVRQDPDNLWAHRTLGAGLMLLNRYSEAAANLRLARGIDAGDQQAWFEYAKALDGMEATEQAESAYLKTIEIDEFSQVAEEARQRLGEKKIHHEGH
jgi:tetratricopeptide (TPR) repeat protein